MVSNGDISGPDVIAPIMCESCLEVSLMINSSIRKMTDQETIEIKKSPAWEVVTRARTILRSRIAAQKAQYN